MFNRTGCTRHLIVLILANKQKVRAFRNFIFHFEIECVSIVKLFSSHRAESTSLQPGAKTEMCHFRPRCEEK